MAVKTNGATVDENNFIHKEELLQDALHSLFSSIIYPEASALASTPLLQRIKISVSENLPRLCEASRNTSRSVLQWTRSGSPLRTLLVISVGTITFLTLAGLLLFTLFFLAATVNAIIISALIALAAAGVFFAIFFACVTVTYIVALSVAAFVISTATISAIIAAVVVTGWIGFFWAVWLVNKKSMELAKHSFGMTGSALSAW
ncbi:putative ADP-ribosylation factor GTPase-activating protein AGD11-like [Hibiscus syriacus]|uniref:ADP-ribosylation factor GTPase-activating protein AGD11-like n=1 Tax=Hibiscus syriacus TaxID=106335 RepID=A0A6A2XCX7_HIBSY|nr:uncharacterized protein LOC120171088 [Hibiscus syriacus]KAE8673142.1 putative ADP-ribosylation factor GTPase-activating protein AGD11-like [Hibiscus syriacus]